MCIVGAEGNGGGLFGRKVLPEFLGLEVFLRYLAVVLVIYFNLILFLGREMGQTIYCINW